MVMWKEWEMKTWQKEQTPRKWKSNGGEEDLNCDGGLHSKLPRKSGRRMEKEQEIEGIGDC